MRKRVHPVPDSSRTPLVPFDQITFPNQQNRQRNRSVMQHYVREIMGQNYKIKKSQQQKLTILSKINDRSYEEISFTQTFFQLINKKFREKIRIFKPDQTFILCWNFLMLFAICFNFLEIPISLFFTNLVYYFQFKEPSIFSLNIIFITALFIDTFAIRLNLAFFRHGKLVITRSQIIKNYLKRDFWFDLIAWLSYLIYIACGNPDLIYLKLLFYLKLKSLSQINLQISYTLSIHRLRFGIYKLFRVVIFVWFATTWVSSMYFAMDYYFYKKQEYYYTTGQLWLTNSNAVQNINIVQSFPHWYIWYQYAMYWAFQTSATIGYGDITPRNPHQVLYCNLIILTNTILFAFYINSIWQIIGQMKQYQNKYTQNWTNLRNYLTNQNLPKQLNHKIGNFLQQMWINENQDYGEQQFANNLSIQLKNQLFMLIRGKFLSGLGMFQQIKKFSLSWNYLVKALVFQLEKVKIGSGQDIYREGDLDEYMYYLSSGKAGIFVQNLQIGRQVQFNHHFGAYQFLTEKRRITKAYSISFCILWRISRTTFLLHLKKFPHLYQKYCELKQRVLFEGEIILCNTKCLKCQSIDHTFRTCPIINKWRKKIIRPLFIKKQIYRSYKSQRIRYERQDYKVPKIRQICLRDHEIICEKASLIKGYRNQYNIC